MLKIGPRELKLLPESPSSKYDGQYYGVEGVITVRTEGEITGREETVFHEVLEAMNDMLGLRLSHMKIHSLGANLQRFLHDHLKFSHRWFEKYYDGGEPFAAEDDAESKES